MQYVEVSALWRAVAGSRVDCWVNPCFELWVLAELSSTEDLVRASVLDEALLEQERSLVVFHPLVAHRDLTILLSFNLDVFERLHKHLSHVVSG